MSQIKPTIECITCIVGDKDFLRNDQVTGRAKFTCYTDNPNLKSDVWEIKPIANMFTDPRRTSRMPKILMHKYSDADVTIWVDGNLRFIVPPEDVVATYLQDYDMALFEHGGRDCVYDEAMECARLGLDKLELFAEQIHHYEEIEYPKHRGLLSGYFIIRRNTRKVRHFNEAWWADYCRFSRRDQISLMPAIDEAGVRYNAIPEVWITSKTSASMGGVVEIQHHKNFEGNFNEKK